MGNETEVSYLEYQGRYKGIWSWLLSTDHKRIGLLYLYAIIFFFFVAATLGLLMRIELIAPGRTIMEPQTYNGFFTIHGIIMIFVIVIPGLAAVFGNFFLPILIGARDVAFPKLNLFSWYLYMIGAILGVLSQFMGSGPPDTGWTFYVPYSVESATSVIWALTAAFILGFSSILTGLNFIVTIHRMRAPGMKWMRMPLFPVGDLCHCLDTGSCHAHSWNHSSDGDSREGAEHRFLRSGPGRRPGAFPASVLDLFTSGGIYHDTACNGCCHGDLPDLQPEAGLRLRGHSALEPCHCLCRLFCLGTPYVHLRHELLCHGGSSHF